MSEPKYLYGAAVQGIQGFIFSSNDLKSIVGASELVEEICTTMFDDFADGKGKSIIRAAGNIKFIFDTRKDCEKAVLEFPKLVMKKAPGITISQAVVPHSNPLNFEKDVDLLEARLREQRNKPVAPLTIGMIGIQRSRQTGLPVAASSCKDYLDFATLQKLEYTDDANSEIVKEFFGRKHKGHTTTNISKLTGKNDWVAIIHADGNGLGKVVAQIGKDEDTFIAFSHALEQATKNSARKAYELLSEDLQIDEDGVIPIRPIILGGDDITIVCRADVALPFVNNFLVFFEAETYRIMSEENNILKDFNFKRLTACAGIAYVKSSYPFHYGYRLAEALCERAKKDAKREENQRDDLATSCLMFHKVQDSFIEDYERIAARELTTIDKNNQKHSYEFGPYYLNYQDEIKNRWTINELVKHVELLLKSEDNKDANASKSHLRQWMSEMSDNPYAAVQLNKRTLAMLGNNNPYYGIVEKMTRPLIRYEKNKPVNLYPVYDVLSLVSMKNQVTKMRYLKNKNK